MQARTCVCPDGLTVRSWEPWRVTATGRGQNSGQGRQLRVVGASRADGHTTLLPGGGWNALSIFFPKLYIIIPQDSVNPRNKVPAYGEKKQ